MKKFIFIAAAALAASAAFAGCAKKSVDFNDYISEKRTDIYQYSADGFDFFLNTGTREQPFEADGYRGEIFKVGEAFAFFDSPPSAVEIRIGEREGEMNYDAPKKRFYLNFPDFEIESDEIEVKLEYDEKEVAFTAQSVLYDGVMSCEEALECVKEHDGELFSALSDGEYFKGEIFIRLLYEDGCYYYVGVCDRQGKISAYLVDGEHGKILAKKKM